MVTTLIVSQGNLANEILQSTKVITGGTPGIRSLCMEWGDGLEASRDRIAEAVRELDEGEGVLILTDLHGATPTNAALMLAEEERVEVVCGVNLPMVARLACCKSERLGLTEMARWIAGKGGRAITHLHSKRVTLEMKAPA